MFTRPRTENKQFLRLALQIYYLTIAQTFDICAEAAAWNFIKTETPTQVLSCEYCEIFKDSFFIAHLRWMLRCIFHLTLILSQNSEANLQIIETIFLEQMFKENLGTK